MTTGKIIFESWSEFYLNMLTLMKFLRSLFYNILKANLTITPCQHKHELWATAICQIVPKMTGQSNWKNIQALHPVQPFQTTSIFSLIHVRLKPIKQSSNSNLRIAEKHASSKTGSKVTHFYEVLKPVSDEVSPLWSLQNHVKAHKTEEKALQ